MEEALDYDGMEYLIEGSQNDLFSVAAKLRNLSIDIKVSPLYHQMFKQDFLLAPVF